MFESARKMRARHEAYARGERREAGVSMVELLGYIVVAAIIIGGILVGVTAYRKNAADGNARSDVQAAVTTIESYRTTHDDALPTAAQFTTAFTKSGSSGTVTPVFRTDGTYCVSVAWDTGRYGAATATDGLFHYDSANTGADARVSRGGCGAVTP